MALVGGIATHPRSLSVLADLAKLPDFALPAPRGAIIGLPTRLATSRGRGQSRLRGLRWHCLRRCDVPHGGKLRGRRACARSRILAGARVAPVILTVVEPVKLVSTAGPGGLPPVLGAQGLQTDGTRTIRPTGPPARAAFPATLFPPLQVAIPICAALPLLPRLPGSLFFASPQSLEA